MPKLPEIRYSTNVQSLGREDVGAPGRLAAARIGAAQSIFEGVKEVERSFAAAEYTKQMSQARNSINELYDAVVSKEAFTSSEIPEFVTGIDRHETVTQPDGTEIVQERIIPASEVREQWFKQGMQNITNGVLKGTKTPTARTRISNELKTSIGPAAHNQLLQYNRAAVKKEQLAILDASVQDAVINGDRLAVEETLYRFLVSGLISKDDYETRKLTASQDLDIESYTENIFTANDEGDLDGIWDQLAINSSPTKPGNEFSDMTPEQRRSLRASLNSQRTVLAEEKNQTQLKTNREGMDLLINNELTDQWLLEKLINGDIERPAAQALRNDRDSGSGSSKIVRDHVIASEQSIIQQEIYYPPFGEQISDIGRTQKDRILKSTTLNGAEKVDLIDYVTKVEKQVRDTPAVKEALVTIRNYVGLPDADAAGEFKLRMDRTKEGKLAGKAYADFSRALFNYVDEFGVEADVSGYIERNKEKYDYVTKERQTLPERILADYPELIIGEFDSDRVMYEAYKKYQQDDDEQALFDIWSKLSGNALDLEYLGGL